MGETSTHLGTFIRECRKGLRYTSRQVARLSNSRTDIPSISNSYLISVENGKHIPRLDKVIALADILNVPITHLVDRCREDIGTAEVLPPDTDYHALFEAGREHAEMNDHGQALVLFRRTSQAISDRTNGNRPDPVFVTELRLQIANCYRRLKVNRVAKEELETLLKDRDLDLSHRARTALALAEIYREENSVFLAAILAREALGMARTVGDEVLEGKLLAALGNIAAEEYRLDEALALYREAGMKLKKHGHERAATNARTQQGLMLVAKRDFHRAVELLRAELNDCRLDDPYVRGWLHLALAKAHYGAENLKSTRIHARSAKEHAEKIEAPDLAFLGIYYMWLVARREHADDLVNVYVERLRYYRNKFEVSFDEVEQFDRIKAKPAETVSVEKGAVR